MKTFKKLAFTSVLSAALVLAYSNRVHAEEYATGTEATQTALSEKSPDSIRIAKLAELSGKSQDEIMKMRTEQHMGWGKIAKELGLPPGEMGKAVAESREDDNKKRKEDHRKERDEKREAREKRKEEKREAREKHSDEKSNAGKH